MTYNRIIMFCDYGLDDAVATLHILKNAGMFDHIDIVPVGGNVDVSTAYRNAHTLLNEACADINKVRIVDTRAIAQNHANIPEVHGNDGMGDILPASKSELPVVAFDDFKKEIEINAKPTRDCVLSVGPCTVPALLSYIPFCTVIMGGTTKCAPNYGGYEFNEGMDVTSFSKLAPLATAVATLDSCRDERFKFDGIAHGDELCAKLFSRYKQLCENRGERVAVYDYVAALAVTDPEKFSAVRVRRKDGVEYNELVLNDM